ncbi:MAG: phytoene desaturase family protein [Pseudomonadota bacterium]
MAEHKVVVIGAGMAGLVSALQLANAGLSVTVVDKAAGPGGKLRQLMPGGVPVDSGPTVFTMRWVFDQIMASVGTRLESELKIQPLNVLARHFWQDGSQLDLYADPVQSQDAVARFAGPSEAKRFAEFCRTARQVYDALEGPFIKSPSPTMAHMMGSLGPRGLAALASAGPMRSLWNSLGKHFVDQRLRQLFARYATYCGSSPWEAPATLMLIAQVEMDGVWTVDGGMHALAVCLMRLGQKCGVNYVFNSACERIEMNQGKVTGVRLAQGDSLRADSVVFNGDIAALRKGLLGPTAQRSVSNKIPPRSLSAVTWSMQADTGGMALDRHNVFFNHDYASEFLDIFHNGRLPRQPTVYVCAQDRGTGHTQSGAERLLCLVNAPARGDKRMAEEELQACTDKAQAVMAASGLRLTLEPTASCIRTTPQDFHQLFPATGGALYGQATHGWMSAFSRCNARSQVAGLYLAGGSVHPGPGVPMAAMSGQLAAAAVMADLGLTSLSPKTATSGGTLTH